jgi:hypothetical protein
LTLLFRLAEWHALAKLRLHTESTLTHMDQVTTVLGQELRQFCSVTCSAFKTTELAKEAATRARRRSRKEAHSKHTAAGLPALEIKAKESAKNRRPKTLNLFIYKVHALGDYAETIRRLGTTDSFSTQIVSFFNLRLFGMPSSLNCWLAGRT